MTKSKSKKAHLSQNNLNTITYPPKTTEACNFVQVNSCHNIDCDNFNVPIEDDITSKRFRTCGNDYMLQKDHGPAESVRFKCLKCNEWGTLYNNKNIYNEYLGISGYFEKLKRTPSCKNLECVNYGLSVKDNPDEYVKNGKTAKGMTKYRCKCPKSLNPPIFGTGLPDQEYLHFSALY